MVKLYSFLIALVCVCSTWHSAQAILVEGARWTLGKKEILFLFDIHNQIEFEDDEKKELETFIEILKLYVEADDRPLYILIEENSNTESVLGSLRKRLAEEGLSSKNIIVENIEQRAASVSASDVLSGFPHHYHYHSRTSTTQTCYPQTVSMQEVLDEYAVIDAYLQECYNSSSDIVKTIHNERLHNITCFRDRIKQRITYLSTSLDLPLASILDTSSPEQLEEYRNLGKSIFAAASAYMDLYAFHRVLTLSDHYKVALVAGGLHCRWVESSIMGSLDAVPGLDHGVQSSISRVGKKLCPLQSGQLLELILA